MKSAVRREVHVQSSLRGSLQAFNSKQNLSARAPPAIWGPLQARQETFRDPLCLGGGGGAWPGLGDPAGPFGSPARPSFWRVPRWWPWPWRMSSSVLWPCAMPWLLGTTGSRCFVAGVAQIFLNGWSFRYAVSLFLPSCDRGAPGSKQRVLCLCVLSSGLTACAGPAFHVKH